MTSAHGAHIQAHKLRTKNKNKNKNQIHLLAQVFPPYPPASIRGPFEQLGTSGLRTDASDV